MIDLKPHHAIKTRDCALDHYGNPGRRATLENTADIFDGLCSSCISDRGYSAMRMMGGSRSHGHATLVDGTHVDIARFTNHGFNGITFHDRISGEYSVPAGLIAEKGWT